MNKRLIIFIILTFSISWTLWYYSGILFRTGAFVYDDKWLIAQIRVFAPALSALIISGFKSKKLLWNGVRFFLLFVLIFITGKIIAKANRNNILNFPETTSLLIISIGILAILFFSSFNKLLLIPATGKKQGKSKVRLLTLALLGFPVPFILVWSLLNIQGSSWTVSSLQNGHQNILIRIITIFFMNLILGGSIGEEIGWRGFAMPILLKKFSPVEASFILGLTIAIWHLPIDASSLSYQAIGLIIFRIIWALSLSIIFTWFYLKTENNLLIVIILHTSINILPDLGFSLYQQSIVLFTIILVIISILVSLKLHNLNDFENQADDIIH